MYKRLPAILLICALIFACPRPSLADTAPVSAPMTAGNAQNGMVRVRLSSLGNFSSLNLTICGSYSVSGSSTQTLGGGAAVTVKFNSASGRFTLVSGGASADMGTSFRLCRHATDGQNGVKIAQGGQPGNLYPGDFQFVARSSNGSYVPWVIAHIFMEDYLYGVVPYEMNDASGTEALKAQAVAARTYTMLRMSAAGGALYDVVDTTADQVYAGTPSGSANCKAAVDATKGIALKNGASFTATYYTASNGGQTESIKNAWGTAGLDYLGVKDDPYDLKNPDSRKVSFSVSTSGAQSDSRVSILLNRKAASQFGAGSSVTAVTAVYAHTPKYAAPSRLYTKLSFDVLYTRNGQTGAGTLTFDIFSELESALSMNLTSGSNELWSVTQEYGCFTVTARRFGHGIGMSQRGAMYMGQLGYTYDQILGFYYEGCTRVAYTLTRSILSPAVPGQKSQEQVITEQPVVLEPSSTGLRARVTTLSGSLNLRETPSADARVLRTIPQNETIPILEKSASWCKTRYGGDMGYVMTQFLTFLSSTARVATQNDALNLRELPSTSAPILGAIPRNAAVSVLEQGAEWCRVSYNGVTGYVMAQYLSFSGGSAPAAEAETALTPLETPVSAWIMPTASTLNLRDGCSLSAELLMEMPKYDMLIVTAIGDTWCAVVYEGRSGYCMTKYLEFIDE
ncbi:MAG: SpoIID/LytB domain-containing protein [Clostridia bacterium]|nr:SpoIID/LytB domain-containing protein [Clostridia bacterium]